VRIAKFSPYRWTEAHPDEYHPVPEDVLIRVHDEFLGRVEPFAVWMVDGGVVRNEVDVDFTVGGNPAVYGYIPKDEIWVDHQRSPKDLACDLVHELVETWFMNNLNMGYDDAHDRANEVENRLRETEAELPDRQAVVPFAEHHYQAWLEAFSKTPLMASVRVAARYLTAAGYLNVGDIVLYGKYKNHRGRIVNFSQDHWGNPTIEIEPVPKGRKQNKIMGLFKVWRADVKEKALAEQAKAEQAKQAMVGSVLALFTEDYDDQDDDEDDDGQV
jgi:hypothetical protein